MNTDILNLLVKLTVEFATLLGVGALIAAVVNVLKTIHVVQDGTAPWWSAALALLAFIAVALLRIFRPDLSLDFLDETAMKIATVLTYILGFITTLVTPALFHRALKNAQVPVLGKSFTPKE